MTQIPEVGSEWTNNHNQIIWKVVFADAISVLIECYDGLRTTFDADDFKERFSPIPRKTKYQRWVNLYADGRIGVPQETESGALKAKEHSMKFLNRVCAETRLIEWEVEE